MVIVMTDKETGNSRGFGFVTYSGKASADVAIKELHKFELMEGKNYSK